MESELTFRHAGTKVLVGLYLGLIANLRPDAVLVLSKCSQKKCCQKKFTTDGGTDLSGSPQIPLSSLISSLQHSGDHITAPSARCSCDG
jgi:hypothetical protein